MATPTVYELRVHGVSGTPPQALLNCPEVVQVAGDRKAGFYRPRLAVDQRDPVRLADGSPDPDAAPGPLLEGYAWGGLTSGAPSRALWLLLLPFTLTNVAPRLRPATKVDGLVRVMWFVSRLLALSMTVLITAAVTGIGDDLFGWQCRNGSTPDCSKASPSWIMHPLLELSTPHRLAVGALLPLLVLVLLWQISGRTINNYESTTPNVDGTNEPSDAGSDDVEPNLTSAWMWRNEQQVRRLRHLHLQAGFATVLWTLTYALSSQWRTGARVGCAVLVVYIVAMLLIPAYTGRGKRQLFTVTNWVVWAILAAVAIVVGIELLWHHPVPTDPAAGGLPGFAGTVLVIFVAQLGLAVAFAVLIGIMAIRSPALTPRSVGNLSAVVMVAMAVFLGAVFSSGAYVFATGWLTTGSLRPGFKQLSVQSTHFDLPNAVLDATRAYAISVAGLAITILAIVLVLAVNRILRLVHLRSNPSATYHSILEQAYPEHLPDLKSDRGRQIGKTFWLARQVDFAQRYLAGLVGLGFVITAFFTVLLTISEFVKHPTACLIRWHDYTGPSSNVTPCGSQHGLNRVVWHGFASASSLQGTGAYLVVITLVLLVALGAAAYRVQSTRRSVGILWDLASFWPRSAHPFAAPCYAERTVPDLITRVANYVDNDGHVVLAAHSQGCVIGAAALFQLQTIDGSRAAAATKAKTAPPAPLVDGVAFLTFGNVLRRLYARYFPVYFNADVLAQLQTEVLTASRWRNLWRFSDYLGGQFTAGPPPDVPAPSPGEIECTDPAWDRAAGDTRYPAALAHSDYWLDPTFQLQVSVLATAITR